LTPLNKVETIQLAEEFSEIIDIQLTETDFEYIYKLSKGHSWLIKDLVKLISEGKNLSKTSLKEILAYESINTRLEQIIHNLSNIEKQTLINISVNNDAIDQLSLKFLENTGFITKGNLKYEVFSPILKEFLQTQKAQDLSKHKLSNANHRKTHIYSIDHIKMELCKYGKPTGIIFSKSEFEVLDYLVKNSNSVVSREKIAEVMWKDLSFEKYSDWAIDKMISRIREKFEENSKKPQFLITLRSIGFKFVN